MLAEEALRLLAKTRPDMPLAEALAKVDHPSLENVEYKDTTAFALWVVKHAPTVCDYLKQDGKMIHAIKELRTITKCHLKEAKYACELARELLKNDA